MSAMKRPAGKRNLRHVLMILQEKKCFICGREMVYPTFEHILPQWVGGSNGTENLCLTCSPCNNSRGDFLFPIEQFRAAKKIARQAVEIMKLSPAGGFRL